MADRISRTEFEERISDLLESRLPGLPRRWRDRHIFLKSVAITLDPHAQYSERELDDKLLEWLTDVAKRVHMDHVNLRRLLVEHGYLGRKRDGSSYWVAALGPHQDMFEPEVDEVDPHRVLRDSRKRAALRKLRHIQSNAEPGTG
ncbi:MAG: DUF2087 domain-containing protein [Chloroflexota bacterium]